MRRSKYKLFTVTKGDRVITAKTIAELSEKMNVSVSSIYRSLQFGCTVFGWTLKAEEK